MEYLNSFVSTFGVFNAAGIILLTLGVLIVLCWLLALLLENFVFLTVALLLFVLHGLVQVLFLFPGRVFRKETWMHLFKHPRKGWTPRIVHTLPVALMFFLVMTAHCKAAEADRDSLAPGNSFVFPLTLHEEPMKYLLVANFKDDSEYEGIEPQLFEESTSGKGLKILMYRKDKKVDVYYEPGIRFDEKTFKIGEGLGYTAATVMSPSRFAVSENGVDIDIAFVDKSGRTIKIRIKENTQNIHPFPFLAPVGNDVKDPNKLFAVYMKEFDFVKREGTIVQVTIGDRELTPETFPISRDGQKVYLMRYASKLVIGEINNTVTKPVVIENVFPGIIKAGNLNLLFNEENEVQHCWIGSKSDSIELKFKDGFPNLLTLPQNRKVKGSWRYAVTGEVLFGGRYSLVRDSSKVYIELDVTKKWKPDNIPFNFKAFTAIVRFFRTWPVSYKWNATVDLNSMSVESQWQRK